MESNQFSANDIALVTGMIAVFGPAFVHLSSPYLVVGSMMWEVVFELTRIVLLVNPVRLIIVLPLTCMRFAVPVVMSRLYQNRTTVRRALMIILVSEIQPILIYDIPLLLAAIYWGLFPFYLPFMIPVPILALSAILILWLYPPPKKEIDWVEPSKQAWWHDSNQV